MDENKKFIIIYVLLVAIAILNILELKRPVADRLLSSQLVPVNQSDGHITSTDDPSLRRPGGYHYERVKLLATGAQKKINAENQNLDIEKCKEAYLAYYSRQTEEEAHNALLTIHSCER